MYTVAEIYAWLYPLPLTGAVFDLPLTLTSESIKDSHAIFLDPDNGGVGNLV